MNANFLTTPQPHEEGAKYLRNKPVVTRAVFDALAPELQARAFVISGVEALDAVARVRELTARLPLGGDYDELKGEILAELSPWLVTSTDPEERAKEEAAARRRAEMLLRMHGWQTYARTQHALMEANIDVFPFRQYLSSEDSRVRPSHAALNRKILPADHPFWANHTPPWEFGCRCDVVPLTQDEVDEIAAGEAGKPPEDREVMPAAQIAEIENNGRIVKPGGQGFLDVRTPRERNGEGYEWRPGDDALAIDQILERFTPGERAAFEDFAARQRLEDGRTLLDWWKSGRALTPAAVNVPAAPAIPAAIPAVKPAVKKAAKKAAKKAVAAAERMREKIANAAYRTATPLGGGVNTTIRLKNGVEVVFKPAAGERLNVRTGIPPRAQYLREKAASIVDQYLGTNLVPATEIITHQGEVGSAQLFRKGAKTAYEMRLKRQAPQLDPETLRRWQLLDDVIGNLDRHQGNYMIKRTSGAAFDELILIDNGLSLSEDERSSGMRFAGPLGGTPLDAASRAQLDSFLARKAEWAPQIEGLIGSEPIRLMEKRIRQLKRSGFGIIAKQL